ncbi:[FeFe] hydrogenase H-cluster radical SAM maturase HydE [Candidatus Fermentibacteria bacterium]|nr:[FeFe] hydrogenase H-cluster radical SAM maturase HydE [Candidatus Fermentibacteria bacterium]
MTVKDRFDTSRSGLEAMLLAGEEEAFSLFAAAREVRREHFGSRAFIRAVIEFSNRCRCNCLYCGMRKDNNGIERFTLDGERIVDAASAAFRAGIRTFFLQSAESEDYDPEWLAGIIRAIHGMGMTVLLCVGARTEDDLDLWREAGASKFILKHETSDPDLFGRMKPGLTLAGRIEWLKTLKRHGYGIGSGPLLGLPGQTVRSLVDDLLLLRDLDVDMSSVSVFLPAAGTPLEKAPTGSVDLGLRFMAAMRILLKRTLIPATSTFERLRSGGQLACFDAGANVITVNMTPPSVRGEYALYTERFFVSLEHARGVIRRAGLEEAAEAI